MEWLDSLNCSKAYAIRISEVMVRHQVKIMKKR